MDGFRGDSRGGGPASDVDLSIELEHAIGYAGAVFDGVQYHPNGRDYVYAAGACVGESPFTPLRCDGVVCFASLIDYKFNVPLRCSCL
jgi:hypothetical protein